MKPKQSANNRVHKIGAQVTAAKHDFWTKLCERQVSVEPVQKAQVESQLRELYWLLDRDPPQIFWCDSPFQIFAIPLLINLYGVSVEADFKTVWSKIENDYFSLLSDDLLGDIDLDAFQKQLSMHFPLGSTAFRPVDKPWQIWRLIDSHMRDAPLEFNISPESWSTIFTSPRQLGVLRNNYDRSNQLIWRDLITPFLMNRAFNDPDDRVKQWNLKNLKTPRAMAQYVDRFLRFVDYGNSSDEKLDDLRYNFELMVREFNADHSERGLAHLAYWHLLCEVSLKKLEGLETLFARIIISWAELNETLTWLACFRNCVFLSERPVELHTDSSGRLHCAGGPALRFKDGYSQYYWHGISVPIEALKMDPNVENIDSISNIEVRRTLIERMGVQEYLFASGAKIVDVSQSGTLYRKEVPNDEPMLMVHVVNKTPEPDGSYKDYFLRVPPHVRTAREAVAWTFDLEGDSYKPLKET